MEKYLSDGGDIYIGYISDNHIKVVLIDKNRKMVEVESQKGFEHALKALEAKIKGGDSLCLEVENQHPYCLNWNTKEPVDHFINRRSFHIYEKEEGIVMVDVYQLDLPDKHSIPGLYKSFSHGSTIIEAITNVIKNPNFELEKKFGTKEKAEVY